MPVSKTLSFADLAVTHSSVTAEGEDVEFAAVDHPYFYCTLRADGVRRAPLPPLVDRGDFSPWTIEDEIIARIDAANAPATDLDDEDGDEEFRELSHDDLDEVEPRRIAVRPMPADKAASLPAKAAPIVDDETLPTQLSSRRARRIVGPKTVLHETGPDQHCWKNNTRQPAQHMRHVRHG